MVYREFPPSAALRPFVDRLWFLEGAANEIAAEPIPPDGHTEIIVHAADPFVEVAADGATRTQAAVLLAGQATRAVRVRPTGFARMVGARLRPHGARAWFRVPQHELTDRVVDLGGLDRTLARRLADDVAGRETSDAMAAALDRVLGRAGALEDNGPDAAGAAVALAFDRGGLARVPELAARAGMGSRQLERLFQDRVGISPKQLLRIVRFQHVLRAVRRGAPDAGWADLAAAHGFSDQSHFIRDFKAFVGAPPGSWSAHDDSLAAVFSAIRRD